MENIAVIFPGRDLGREVAERPLYLDRLAVYRLGRRVGLGGRVGKDGGHI